MIIVGSMFSFGDDLPVSHLSEWERGNLRKHGEEDIGNNNCKKKPQREYAEIFDKKIASML